MAYVAHYSDVPQEDLHNGDTIKFTKKRVLIGEKEGAPNFIMRYFTIEKNGFTPLHKHPWEHESFVLKGEGIVQTEDSEKKIKPGDFVYIPSNELHQFKNIEEDPLEFLCIIPMQKEEK